MKAVLFGSQDPYCQICRAPLRKLEAMSLRRQQRVVFTYCDTCDTGAEMNQSEWERLRKLTDGRT